MKHLLLIGPLPDPVTGVSLANKMLLDNVSKYDKEYLTDSINMSYHQLENLGKFSLKKTLFYVGLYKSLSKIFKADIVYITPGQTFFGIIKYAPFVWLSKLLGKQLIAHIHGNHLHEAYANAGWKKPFMRAVICCIDKGIVLSPSLLPNLIPFIAKKHIYSLANFAEDFLFEATENKLFHTDKLRVLYLSNLIPEKGIFDLLEALKKLKAKKVPFLAQIAGAIDAQHQQKLDALFKALAPEVEYLGVVHAEKKKDALINSNVFVFPTYYPMEGQPIALLEAMATGNVILTTNHAGIPDIFEDGKNGYYIDKHSPNHIAECLERLAAQPAKEISLIVQYNKHMANQHFRIEHFVRNFISILEK